MKLAFNNRQTIYGATLIEVILIVCGVLVMAFLMTPTFVHSKSRARATACINNLKQVGIGFTVYANDHNGNLPMQVSTNDGGSKEWMTYPVLGAVNTFLSASNQIKFFQLLNCPGDTNESAKTWEEISSKSLSYFIEANATLEATSRILSGDARIADANNKLLPLTVRFETNGFYKWHEPAPEIHDGGNLLWIDGSAARPGSSDKLRMAIRRSLEPNSLTSVP